MAAPKKDRRVQKTERVLREALTSLMHEKSYDTIAVKEIVGRADVGRSAFYTHFHDKDSLLASGIHEILDAARPAAPNDRGLWFSLPVLEYVGRRRHASHIGMDARGRAIVHEHLRQVLVERLTDDEAVPAPRSGAALSRELLIDYLATTFVLVLNWWIDSRSPLSPREVDGLYRSLVGPTLAATTLPP
ncbi:MAG TPA: TetR/AcrR family transcriptional regulator [Vicinamibacterales bacterium]|nr:TetR/AcrR family transcriptional regulator [Vicinamibacterales bacterium]